MAYIVSHLDSLLAIKDFVGSHECVALVQQWAGAPHGAISSWHPGDKVLGLLTIARGTAIATFPGGRYDGHAAIYLGQDGQGIQVFDQWQGHKPSRRTIYSHGQHAMVDTAANYYVIQ
jgi:hypothetical protein